MPNRQTALKSSTKDRLGTPVKKPQPVRQRLNPKLSTSRHQHDDIGRRHSTANETQVSGDQIDGVSLESIVMTGLNSILNNAFVS